ncbi:MAG: Asp-tRNA(Asn)/Glu-tRNA(Gln) amidotransferase GatCAB subunit B, partial [Chloroflexota bacterium]
SLRYLGVNHGDMSKGILRFEANVSVMHEDDTEFRQRTEIKNLNSIRSLQRSIDYEVKRQIKLYESGDTVKSATLGWDENKQKVTIQRYKERADEYRYFPDPDLPIVVYTKEQVDEVRAKLPELPHVKMQRFMDELGLSAYDADILVSEKAVANYYEQVLAQDIDAKIAANWMLNSLFGLMNEDSVSAEDIFEIKVTPQGLAAIVNLVEGNTINRKGGETVLKEMFENGGDAEAIVEAKGLKQVSDASAIEPLIDEVLGNNEKLVQRYVEGDERVFGALMGQCMKALKGKGNPQVVKEILTARLTALREA